MKFRTVTKEEFFAAIGLTNVHPSHNHEDYTLWETPDRRVVGKSLPGWKNPGDPKVWMLPDNNV